VRLGAQALERPRFVYPSAADDAGGRRRCGM